MMKKKHREINISEMFVCRDLHDIRQTKGISRKDVAEETGLTESMVSNIENGQNVGFHNIVAYADYFGYDVILRKRKPTKIVDTFAEETIGGVKCTYF